MGLVFLTGGARSGKSHLAVQLAREASAEVVFVATAEAQDEDMGARIARHRRDRPGDWTVVEEPRDLLAALVEAPDAACVVVDCLTLWVSNLMFDEYDDAAIEALAEKAAAAAAARSGDTLVVSNEVGSGVHAPTELGRRYADVLGRVNVIWAQAADEAYLVVAGKRLRLG